MIGSIALRVSFAVAGILLLAGCGTKPYATIGDPAVYTHLHMRQLAAELGARGPQIDPRGMLDRHLLVTQSKYDESRTRLDDMLTGSQRGSAFVQYVKTLTAIDVALTLAKKEAEKPAAGSGGNAPSNPPANQPGQTNGEQAGKTGDDQQGKTNGDQTGGQSGKEPTGKTSMSEIIQRLNTLYDSLAKDGNFDVIDSPFDYVDRASDLFTAYQIKTLRGFIDSNAQVQGSASTPPANQWRQVMLMLQVHVHPGTKPNQMTGVRVRVVGARKSSGSQPAAGSPVDWVKVQRVHPTRTYDVEQVALSEAFEQAMNLSAKLTAPLKKADVDVKVDRDVDSLAAARRRFLSRISKQASLVDASKQVFGWNFYPSNLEVRQRNFVEGLVGWLFDEPSRWTVNGYLEGGARDCAVYLLVPADLESIDFEMTCFSSDVDRTHTFSAEEDEEDSRSTGRRPASRFQVKLPPYRAEEGMVLGAGGGGFWPLDSAVVKAHWQGRVIAELASPVRGLVAEIKAEEEQLKRASAVAGDKNISQMEIEKATGEAKLIASSIIFKKERLAASIAVANATKTALEQSITAAAGELNQAGTPSDALKKTFGEEALLGARQALEAAKVAISAAEKIAPPPAPQKAGESTKQ